MSSFKMCDRCFSVIALTGAWHPRSFPCFPRRVNLDNKGFHNSSSACETKSIQSIKRSANKTIADEVHWNGPRDLGMSIHKLHHMQSQNKQCLGPSLMAFMPCTNPLPQPERKPRTQRHPWYASASIQFTIPCVQKIPKQCKPATAPGAACSTASWKDPPS